ncbi:hypothetical protein J7K24_02955 [bacterium]|nr:hypothetical protein [bacterium]
MKNKSFLVKNRRIIILFLILIIAAASQWLVELYFKGASCIKINRNFYSELRNLNKSCQTDQDCKVVPIGIGLCLNKDQDTTRIEQLDKKLKECIRKQSSYVEYPIDPTKLIKQCECRDGICRGINLEKKLNQVTITTDKTEYEQGEDIEMFIKNESNESIYLSTTECTGGGELNNLTLERYSSGNWKNQEFMNYPKPKYFACFVKCIEIKEGEEFNISGNKLEYYDYNKKANFPLIPGKYRFRIVTGKQCEKDTGLKNTSVIYSNEFIIK